MTVQAITKTNARLDVWRAIAKVRAGMFFLDLCELVEMDLEPLKQHLLSLVADGSIRREHSFGGWHYVCVRAPVAPGVDIDAVHRDPRWGS